MRKKHFRKKSKKRFTGYTGLLVLMVVSLTAVPAAAAPRQLTDTSISDVVEDELLMDTAVPSHLINVVTVDGVVTLSGSVDNILAKERAARIAQTVKGVRSVVNKIIVDPSILRTDSQILDDVQEALLMDPATEAYEIKVAVDDNVVTLSGTVDSWQEKVLCEKVTKGVKGVKDLKSDITVVWPEKRRESEIKADVEKTLAWDLYVDHALIDVDVEGDKVILSGTVGSAAEKSQAYCDAFVNGVAMVDTSELKVKKWARDDDLRGKKYIKKSDEEITAAVKDALFYDPRVSSFDITPEVAEDGATVILRGRVDNLKAKRAAAQDARNTVGVRNVENRIKVRPAVLSSDERIELGVESALLRDPYVEKYEIAVDVINGVANLYGTVDTFFEKSKADEVASRVDGVIVVDNNLVVEKDYDLYTYDPYVDRWYYYDDYWYDYEPYYPAKTDSEIKADIQDELWWSPFVDSDDIKTTVEDGVATLTGTVDSLSEYNAAENNAYEGGALYVDNDLTIQTAS